MRASNLKQDGIAQLEHELQRYSLAARMPYTQLQTQGPQRSMYAVCSQATRLRVKMEPFTVERLDSTRRVAPTAQRIPPFFLCPLNNPLLL